MTVHEGQSSSERILKIVAGDLEWHTMMHHVCVNWMCDQALLETQITSTESDYLESWVCLVMAQQVKDIGNVHSCVKPLHWDLLQINGL